VDRPSFEPLTFAAVVSRLEAALARPLPGEPAQLRMAPQPRRPWPDGWSPARLRHAAGLLAVFPGGRGTAGTTDRAANILLTRRADHLDRHRGQIALPGGVVDPGESFEQAALREAHEEVGLEPVRVRVLGALTPLDIPVSGFRLHPVVGVLTERPVLTPSDREVAAILDVPVADLTDPANLARAARDRDGVRVVAPAFRVEGGEIWGATAMIVAEFLALLGWPDPAADVQH